MIKASETNSKTLKLKDVYVDGESVKDEDDSVIDINKLLKKVFGDGATLAITASAKNDAELQV